MFAKFLDLLDFIINENKNYIYCSFHKEGNTTKWYRLFLGSYGQYYGQHSQVYTFLIF